jgi:hypothetical protein
LKNIGSDHFPLLIGLNYEPDDDNTEGLEKTDAGEEAEVEEKIEEGFFPLLITATCLYQISLNNLIQKIFHSHLILLKS